MYNALVTILLILSVIIIISIIMQPSKQDPAASAFSGGGEQLFERRKARGFEAVMQRFTAVMVAVWLAVGFALVILSSK
ncbi:preprotein translocase subunit SecG [Floricoccus tropicus]|uniref:Protein-export membrane protein SecG n=1 Tax=Floricoccus tropicus TaxID=1859473 RepID=A0A1E8GMP3_9LACT|nr:preprotein translocase subunit SecG [Floricoccus tropicus]OFI49447.1 preprotein translocase subunit SecG [Floricoccus tropicus]